MQHANDAIDEVRKAEFFRRGPKKRGLIKGKKWLLMSRWKNLTLWNYRYRGAMLNYLIKWMDQLKWQRLLHSRNSRRCY